MISQRFGRGLHQVNDLFRSPDEGLGRNVASALNYIFINFLFPLELYGQDIKKKKIFIIIRREPIFLIFEKFIPNNRK